METTTQAVLARVRRFGAQVDPTLPAVDVALPALCGLLDALGADYRVVGGVAVVHHGYARLTVDLDVLVAREDAARLDPHLASAGFARESAHRLRHLATGVRVDLLVEGDALPGRGTSSATAPVLPSPAACASSPSDPRFIGLSGLLDLKLDAGRHQDLADIVALIKPLDEAAYIAAEAAVRPDHRPPLAALRDDALEELAWERATADPPADRDP